MSMSLRIGLLALLALVSSAAVLAVSPVTPWPRVLHHLTGQICVERPENNGVLNIRPAEVVVQGGPTIVLSGGEAACAYVEGGGRYTIWAQSPDPYDPSNAHPTAWRSADREVVVEQGGRSALILCGTGAKGTYENWAVNLEGEPCQ
jgi:hypothetical protein